ncbi:MAG TPA: hypothetical protein VNO81_03900 [Candidatus Nitrosotenuis sp.]|jgi:hypothetical protein|nr:hypothetical protein [Candidatus Nitrosotenuis sp.]
MSTIDPGRSSVAGAAPQRLVAGVTGQNIRQVAREIADQAATVTEVLDSSTRTQMAQDLKALKTQLWARNVSSDQMGHALMAAGAILTGVHGVVVQDLAGRLHQTLRNPQKLDELAEQIGQFSRRQPGEAPPGAAPVFHSLNNQVTQALIEHGVQSDNVPVALFMGGALLQAEAEQK